KHSVDACHENRSEKWGTETLVDSRPEGAGVRRFYFVEPRRHRPSRWYWKAVFGVMSHLAASSMHATSFAVRIWITPGLRRARFASSRRHQIGGIGLDARNALVRSCRA